MKSPREPSITMERSSSSNWVKSVRRLNAHLVLNIGQKESCIASADNALTKEKFDASSKPYYVIKMEKSQGAKHGKSQEQCDNFKANESLGHAKKKGYASISKKTSKGRLVSQFTDCNWLDRRKCMYLNSPLLEDKSDTATRRERLRYENNWTLSVNGQGPTSRDEN